MSYLLRTAESHPEGYHGMYAAPELKKGIIEFIIADRKATGRTQHATKDIILGLKTLYGIEFDLHSVEYVMKHMMTSEGCKRVGTDMVDAVTKKCSDGTNREFVAPYDHIKPQYPPGYYEPGTKPEIPKNLTEDELYKLYKKLNTAFALGANYNPRTFAEFKKSSGY